MAIAATYLSETSFSVPGDLTAEFATGARVLADCGANGLRYGTVTGVSASEGVTTVVLALDAGTLTANLTGVRHGNDVPDSLCNHAPQHAPGGRDPLAAASTEAPGVAELATPAEGVAGTDATRVVPVAVARQQFVSWMRDAMGEFPGMAAPVYNLFAPKLALPGATTFTRASAGWHFGAAGSLREAAVGTPRFDHDPVTGMVRGLRIEGAATRVNTIAAAPTAAESVTVTALTYTISFFGTGAMILSGTYTATVASAGAFPARTSHTFTPAPGTLVLTPSGDVRHLQLEAGSFATTPILGEGSAVTRMVDMTTVALSGIEFNTTEGAVSVEARTPAASPTTQTVMQLDDGTTANRLVLYRLNTKMLVVTLVKSGTAQGSLSLGTVEDDTKFRVVLSWKDYEVAGVLDAGTEMTSSSMLAPINLTTLRIGTVIAAGFPWFGVIKRLALFPRALTAAQRQGMSR